MAQSYGFGRGAAEFLGTGCAWLNQPVRETVKKGVHGAQLLRKGSVRCLCLQAVLQNSHVGLHCRHASSWYKQQVSLIISGPASITRKHPVQVLDSRVADVHAAQVRTKAQVTPRPDKQSTHVPT